MSSESIYHKESHYSESTSMDVEETDGNTVMETTLKGCAAQHNGRRTSRTRDLWEERRTEVPAYSKQEEIQKPPQERRSEISFELEFPTQQPPFLSFFPLSSLRTQTHTCEEDPKFPTTTTWK